MRRFTYKAKDSKTGKIVKGAIQAENERLAGKLLVDQGLTPEKVVGEHEDGFISKIRNRVRAKDKIVFTRQFATLVGAGLPLAGSLRTIVDQTENVAMRRVIEDILADVEGGKPLSGALRKFPEVFDNVYLALVEAGEQSGSLDVSLKRIADQQEKDEAVMSKIRGALIYPAIVLFVIIVVLVFMLLVVVPQVEGLYRDLDKDLPWMTQVMVALADFVMNCWWLILIIVAIAVYTFLEFRKTEVGIRTMAKIKLNVPLFKGMFRRLYMVRFSKTAQNLLASGVSMLETLKLSADAMNNVVVKDEVMTAAEKVKQGKPLSTSLESRDYILPLVPQMASIGEQSGKIDEMLGKAAKVYEDELDELVRTISTMIEPALMVVMAILVGVMVGAILFPIYSLVNDIQMA